MAIAQSSGVPEFDRWEATLRFLAETELALPPTAIYVNLDRENKIQFGERTLKKHLRLMLDAGLVEYYDKDRGYYEITDAGLEWLADRD